MVGFIQLFEYFIVICTYFIEISENGKVKALMVVIRCIDFISANQIIKRLKSLGMSKRRNV